MHLPNSNQVAASLRVCSAALLAFVVTYAARGVFAVPQQDGSGVNHACTWGCLYDDITHPKFGCTYGLKYPF